MKAAVGFQLAQSDLTFDDPEGSKTKITVFDVKYAENGKSYDVGPNEGYVDNSSLSLDLLPNALAFLLVPSLSPLVSVF